MRQVPQNNTRTMASFIRANAKLIATISVCMIFLFWPRSNTVTIPGSSGVEYMPTAGALRIGSIPSECPATGIRYGIMMDAGSTGSRTHIYKFNFAENGVDIALISERFESLKPGLSSFEEDPVKAGESIRPLMKIAVEEIPPASWACTPISLKATAGLRLLGDDVSKSIIRQVRKVMSEYPFVTPSLESLAAVMDGKDEGPYAWLTVNFLLKSLGTADSAAVLDMGGASTQIVFRPSEPLKSAPSQFTYSTSVLGHTAALYQNSYLGLGLKEAVKTVMKAAVKAGDGLESNFYCLPIGYTFEGKGGLQVKNGDGETDFQKCSTFVSSALFQANAACSVAPCAFNGIYQPHLRSSFTGPIYAFSYFYDRMLPFIKPSDKNMVTVGRFKEVGTKVCKPTDDFTKEHSKGTMCADLSYLYALLTTGYGLSDDQVLTVTNKINGVETAWTLGAMITMLK